MNHGFQWIEVAAIVGALSCAAHAGTVELDLPVVRDATVYSENIDGANGVGTAFVAGRTNMGAIRRGLIQFDTSVIPEHAVVLSVEFSLTLAQTNAGDQPMTLHRVLEDWSTGTSASGGGQPATATQDDVTWRYRSYVASDPTMSPAWSVDGGAFVKQPSATSIVGSDQVEYTWASTPALVADVQSWREDASGNRGWILVADKGGTKRFFSSDDANAMRRPRLTVMYDIPCPADCSPFIGDQVIGDGAVNIDDLVGVINAFGAEGPCDVAPDNGDGTYGNGVINIDDLMAVLNAVGACP
ncbi:MAG: DNRLRE domain-containing protein [Planctomycetota bacterium]